MSQALQTTGEDRPLASGEALSARRPRPLRQVFVTGLVLFVVGMLGVTAYALLLLRDDAIRNGLDMSAMHSRALEDFLTDNLQVIELVAVNALAPEDLAVDHRQTERQLTVTLRQQPILRSLSLLDEQGRIVASSNPANTGVRVPTQDYLPLTTQPLEILRIGAPWSGRDFADGRPGSAQLPVDALAPGFIPVTRTLLVAGRPATLLVAINPDHLANQVLYRLDATQGSMRVLRYDGTVLVDSRADARPGAMQDRLLRQLMPGDVEAGRLERVDEDAGAVLSSFRASRLYPFVVITDIRRSHALDPWWVQARTLLSVVLPVLLAICALAAVFYRRQMQLTAQRAESERLQRINAASVFTHAREGIVITDADARIIDVNEAFCRITGYGRHELLGRNPSFLASGRHDKSYFTALWASLSEQGHWYGEIWNRRRDGAAYATMQTISAVRDADGRTQQYVGLLSDITAQKEHQHELERIAHYDALTGLPNRVLLADRLQQSMVQALRRKQRLAVAYLDLDGFKAVNDGHGHEAGDRLLTVVAQRMRQVLREGDTLARLGGDEFVAVLLDLADVEASVPILNRLLGAASQPVHLGSLPLQVSSSVGVTYFPQAVEVDADLLLRQSDQAMYQAKMAGKNRFHFFDPDDDRSAHGRDVGLDRIRRALAEHQFVLHYQPKVNLRTGAVVGAEALIRWQDPDKGLLLPALFLPVIEDHRLSVEVGSWVIDTALAQAERWHAEGIDLVVSVNVCSRQLQQDDFVERLRQLLAAHPTVRPGGLELEVQEISALQDLARVTQVIQDCQAIGVNFAIDDFGTGYSSLNYLKQLPVQQIKIDGSFVGHMLDDADELAVLDGVLRLSAAFHREVVAEGMETVEQGAMLLQLGCELAQGYGIARPMPAADLAAWIRTWRPHPGWAGLHPVGRDVLPLLLADVEVRTWTAAIERQLRSGEAALPTADALPHRLSQWIGSEASARFVDHAAFKAVPPLLQAVRTLVSAQRQAPAQGERALACLGELHGLRNDLLGHLQTLQREIHLS